MAARLELHIGDITRLDVDAIVNAANSSLTEFVQLAPELERVIFACFGAEVGAAYQRLLPPADAVR